MSQKSGQSTSVPTVSSPLPRHIAIIMDGNNRWAKENSDLIPGEKYKELAGHRAGSSAAREIVQACGKKGIEVLTLFAFSSENWQRPKREVSGLMALFVNVLQKEEVSRLHENNVKLRFIGNRGRFAPRLQKLMCQAEEMTQANTGMTVVVAADYGGRWDVVQACQQIGEKIQQGELSSADISEELIQRHICISDLPVPDLCIRTGGEKRVSNFMLWQFAYTEMYFTDTYWPDFDEAALQLALADYASRQRRFGKISEQVECKEC